MQHNPIISGSSEGVCPSGNIRRILSKFPDICRRSHFCMIERFLRFVNGSLLVCVCGSNISRFLNLCARHEIMFWKIQPDSPTQVSFYIRLQDLYELRPYLRKTKTRIHIRKRIGFPFFWQKYRARKLGILVLLCVMAGVWVLSTRIWRIEIKGNSSLGEDAILEYLSAHNLPMACRQRKSTMMHWSCPCVRTWNR